MSTALDLSREELERFVEAARRRPSPPALTPAEQGARERLLDRAREATLALKADVGVRRVFLFGSLTHAAWFLPDSDVDLAVEGLADGDYWRAWRRVEEIIGDRLVDLVDCETARESLR
jgi:predicted nucleotidyltransferase